MSSQKAKEECEFEAQQKPHTKEQLDNPRKVMLKDINKYIIEGKVLRQSLIRGAEDSEEREEDEDSDLSCADIQV